MSKFWSFIKPANTKKAWLYWTSFIENPSGLASTAPCETPVNQSGYTSHLPLRAAILINKVVGLNRKIQLKRVFHQRKRQKMGRFCGFLSGGKHFFSSPELGILTQGVWSWPASCGHYRKCSFFAPPKLAKFSSCTDRRLLSMPSSDKNGLLPH